MEAPINPNQQTNQFVIYLLCNVSSVMSRRLAS